MSLELGNFVVDVRNPNAHIYFRVNGLSVASLTSRNQLLLDDPTPSVRKYKAVRTKNPNISEIRKSNMVFSSTQPKEEFPCAFFGFPLKVRGFSPRWRNKFQGKSMTQKLTVKNKKEMRQMICQTCVLR